jgi:hypothetical protein
LIPFVVSLLVVVKVPVPEQPAPAMVHVPVIAFAAPVSIDRIAWPDFRNSP